jgi:hypothetical protein
MTKDLTELQKKYEALGKEIEKLEKDPNRYFVPERGESYFYVTGSGTWSRAWWYDDKIDNGRLAMDNVYRTEEEAQMASDKQKLLVELKRFADFKPNWYDRNIKHVLCYDHTNKKWEWSYSNFVQWAGAVHFRSEKRVQEAIDHFGDRLNLLLED